MVGNRWPFSVNSHARVGSRWQKPSRSSFSELPSSVESFLFQTLHTSLGSNLGRKFTFSGSQSAFLVLVSSIGDALIFMREMSRNMAYLTIVLSRSSSVSCLISCLHLSGGVPGLHCV